jgi:threonine synthase
MRLYSTRKTAPRATFRDALFKGQAEDGGLFMPERFSAVSWDELKRSTEASFKRTAEFICTTWLSDEITPAGIEKLCNNAYSFSPVLHKLDEFTFCLELYHGPTLSFKDFGARFMAHAMGYFVADETSLTTILVATSGDTGSAVAYAYHRVPGIQVVLLYPSGKVSSLQEKQLTTLGDNIRSIEVKGTFDDCQTLVKKAFLDRELLDRAKLTSANSINIGRLIPQSFYYFWSVAKMLENDRQRALVCVPSGNFGNMTAGLFAKRMGLPACRFIAAVNQNAVVPEYLSTGEYRPRASVQTFSNAMDVGAPSNWERIRDLYRDNHQLIAADLWSTSVNDAATLSAMKDTYDKWAYIADPHTCVGLQALARYRNEFPAQAKLPAVVLSTAHPGKFQDLINSTLNIRIDLPEALSVLLAEDKQSVLLRNSYDDFKDFLWSVT